MTSTETSDIKNVANELSFLLVSHTIHFDMRFGCYGILNFCISYRQAIDKLKCRCSVRFLGPMMGESC
jgi:hypothetical protein